MCASTTTTERQLQQHLEDCFQSLKISVSAPKIQEWADLIYQSMTTPNRLYHNADHVLEVLKNLEEETHQNNDDTSTTRSCDPISKLAVLFHDVIYFSLDKKLSKPQRELLHGIAPLDDQIMLHSADNPYTAMVCAVFGIDTKYLDCIVEDPGRNEFLSALLAIQAFHEFLSKPQLIQLAMAMEATIPFRDSSAMETLFEKGKAAFPTFVGDGIHKDVFVENAVQQAVLVANSDIGIFATTNRVAFLDSNWRLLPEWFPSLRKETPLSTDLRDALASLLKRPSLDVTRIFVSYKGSPSLDELKQRQEQAKANLAFLHDYVAIRLLTILVIMELIEGQGEQGELSELRAIEQKAAAAMGNREEESNDKKHLLDSGLYKALVQGRGMDYSWDAKVSPLGGAVFQSLDCSIDKGKTLLEQRNSSKRGEWLQEIPQGIIAGIQRVVVEGKRSHPVNAKEEHLGKEARKSQESSCN